MNDHGSVEILVKVLGVTSGASYTVASNVDNLIANTRCICDHMTHVFIILLSSRAPRVFIINL